MDKIKMSELNGLERLFLYTIRSRIVAFGLFVTIFTLFGIMIFQNIRMVFPLAVPISVAISLVISYYRPTDCIIINKETGERDIKRC